MTIPDILTSLYEPVREAFDDEEVAETLGKTVVSVLFSLVLGTAGSIIEMSNI